MVTFGPVVSEEKSFESVDAEKIKRNFILFYFILFYFFFFLVNTNNISSNVLKISAISLMLRTRQITEIFNIFDEIFLVFTEKKSFYSP